MSNDTSEPSCKPSSSWGIMKTLGKALVGAVIGVAATLFAVTAFISDFCDTPFFGDSELCEPSSKPKIQPCDEESSTKTCAIHLFTGEQNNQARLRVDVLRETFQETILSTDFHVGDNMKMRFTSDHDGYVFMFNINPDGALITLFPNQYSTPQQTFLSAGKTLTIPEVFWEFEFPVEKPIGSGTDGTLVALLVEDKSATGCNILPLTFKEIQAKEAKILLQLLRPQLDVLTVEDDNGVEQQVIWT